MTFTITTRQEKINWLKRRRKTIGASDIPIIIGLSPYSDAVKLWKEKTSESEPELNLNWQQMQGTIEEPYVRDWYEEKENALFPPQSFVIDNYSASLDGYNEELNRGLEIKCANKDYHELAAKGKIPSVYLAQIYWQYMLSNADRIDYLSYNLKQKTQYIVETVPPNKTVVEYLDNCAKEFWKCVEEKSPPGKTLTDLVKCYTIAI
jgi:putative phage-type endonuclease